MVTLIQRPVQRAEEPPGHHGRRTGQAEARLPATGGIKRGKALSWPNHRRQQPSDTERRRAKKEKNAFPGRRFCGGKQPHECPARGRVWRCYGGDLQAYSRLRRTCKLKRVRDSERQRQKRGKSAGQVCRIVEPLSHARYKLVQPAPRWNYWHYFVYFLDAASSYLLTG